MVFKNKIVWLLLIFTIGWSVDSFAQKRRYGMKRKSKSRKMSRYTGGRTGGGGIGAAKYSTFGFSINAMNYFGDIAPAPKRVSTDVTFTKAGFGLTYSRVVHPNAAVRAAINWGTLTGEDFKTADPTEADDRGRYIRNLHFRNNILEFSLGGEFNFIPNNGGHNNRFPINPYIFLGVAIFKHNPQALAPDFDLQGNVLDRAREWVDLQPLGTEGQNIEGSGKTPYKLISLAIPIGIGVKLRLPGNFDANIEIGFRQSFTDYLDDVSTEYPDLGLLDSELARALSARGAESTSVLSGEDRTGTYNIQNFISPNNGETYAVGDNYSLDGVRGGSADKDMYVITQLRLVYIMGKKSRRKGKFR